MFLSGGGGGGCGVYWWGLGGVRKTEKNACELTFLLMFLLAVVVVAALLFCNWTGVVQGRICISIEAIGGLFSEYQAPSRTSIIMPTIVNAAQQQGKGCRSTASGRPCSQ